MNNRLENNKIASRYARALFESATENKLVDDVAQDLETLSQSYQNVPALGSFLENPSIPQNEKLAFMEQQIGKKVKPLTNRLLQLLVENNRIAILPQLAVQFNECINQRENQIQAEVVTAIELEAELRERIRKALETTFGYSRVDVQNRVDPGLLGGVIVKIQDQVIDGSYMGRLEELRKQINLL